jgi:ketosteroid isomerase-like protein
MSDYARDSLTSFVASGHLRFGYDRIREGYASQFAPGARRDSLRFEEFHVRVLSPALALVNARYILYRDGATSSSGPFTLVMERQTDGWKILHDHTHSDPR